MRLGLGIRLGPMGGGATYTLDVAGPELITNGQFPTDIAGWTDGSNVGGAIAWNAGTLRLTNTTGTSRARQTVSGIEIGKRHAFFARNPSGAVAVSISAGSTTPGSNDYLSTATNPALDARAGSVELTATTTTVQIQFGVSVAGSSDIDNVTLRNLVPTSFPSGRVFTDDFSIKADGPLGVTPDNLMWREMTPQNANHVYPLIAGGKMAVTASASGTTASYPYLKLGNGKVGALYCDIQWSGAGTVAMISMEPTGTLPTVPNITTNSLHIVFTDTKVDITTYVAGVATTETVNYGAAVVKDGRTYAGVGWSLSGNTLTVTLPDGSTIQRTDAKFAQVQGSVAIPEIFYSGAAVGPVTISKVSTRLA